MTSFRNSHAAASRLSAAGPLSGADAAARLPDRIELAAALGRLPARDRDDGHPVAALALLQLANFHEIRTWVGRSEAECLLGEIASQLQKVLPGNATLYRGGHYELALLLTGTDFEEAQKLSKRIRDTLHTATFNIIPAQMRLHCAVGLAEVTAQVSRPDMLLARARHNLDRPAPDADAAHLPCPTTALHTLHRGLRERGLRLNFQPVVDLRGQEPALFEVRSGLVLDGERLTGASLYALAVQNSLGELLDHLVLQRALRLLTRKRDLRLIVNINLNSLVSPDFVSWLAGQLKKLTPVRERLLLQISESDALIAQHHLGPFSEGLRELALPLGIRHFGCSEEPLSYLPLMRTDFIRLDRSRSADIKGSPPQRQALTTLCAALRGKNIQVIAALIEDAALLPRLWEAGIHRVQGNCLQPPASAPRYRFPRRRRES